MLTRQEAERLAAAIHALRPDWPVASLVVFLGRRKDRPLRDVALELTFVALDQDTRTPARIDQDGPWKQITRPLAQVYNFPPPAESCGECGQTPDRHFAPAYADHEWRPA